MAHKEIQLQHEALIRVITEIKNQNGITYFDDQLQSTDIPKNTNKKTSSKYPYTGIFDLKSLFTSDFSTGIFTNLFISTPATG